MTKTALLLTGNPRFSIDFDSQLQNLTKSAIDLYIVFWRRPFGWDPKISENWCNLKSAGEVRDKLQAHLPPWYKIKFIEVLDPSAIEDIPREYEAYNSTPTNVWQQYKCLQYCDKWRRELDDYDLVIRSRTDFGLSEPIDLKLAHRCLLESPGTIYTPNNQRYGYAPNFNDQFAIGLPVAMSIYADAVDYFDQMYNQGVKYNPEYLVQTHLANHGITWPQTSFEIVRDPAHWVPIEHGKWQNI
jgi:hypothetical protein